VDRGGFLVSSDRVDFEGTINVASMLIATADAAADAAAQC
jgi:hypothetical protein